MLFAVVCTHPQMALPCARDITSNHTLAPAPIPS
jgi:hypothetical protein